MSNDDDEPFENLMKEIDKLFEEAAPKMNENQQEKLKSVQRSILKVSIDENRKLQKEADKEIATAATRQDAVFNEEMEEIEKFLSDIRNADKLQLVELKLDQMHLRRRHAVATKLLNEAIVKRAKMSLINERLIKRKQEKEDIAKLERDLLEHRLQTRITLKLKL
ncbi:hypothetical protein L3Y34_012408 [Caenorhabditis briggsae]|uniref:Uncharacterized protein n=1 Tax=Caenorhabditis briggsae TaxID=6238 RepID=A0AAE9CV60_CAEBR|nr:hypothetical protein L3Y34_012408 [Caenorhabditis briggsae]